MVDNHYLHCILPVQKNPASIDAYGDEMLELAVPDSELKRSAVTWLFDCWRYFY
jgi:hypothetical protein